MTSTVSEMLKKLFTTPDPEYRVLIAGMHGAGKTSILYRLKLGEFVTAIPTIGFNVETMEHRGAKLTMWDVGGSDKIGALWRHYYQNTQALIMVVDSNDTERMTPSETSSGYWDSSAQSMLQHMLSEDELRHCKVLVFLNKQDLPGALSSSVIEEKLGIDALRRRGVEIFVQPCSATSGDGLFEGLDWLAQTLRNPKANSVSAPVSENAAAKEHVFTVSAETKVRLETVMPQLETLSDATFWQLALLRQLPSWGHAVKLRLLYVALLVYGRQRGGVDKVLATVQAVEKEGFHLSLTYFWVQMLTLHMISVQRKEKLSNDVFGALTLGQQSTVSKEGESEGDAQLVSYVLEKTLSFRDFMQRACVDELNDQLLYEQYYSAKLLDDASGAEASLQLPDLKPIPSMIK